MNPDVMNLIEEADALRKQYEASGDFCKDEKISTLATIVGEAFRLDSIPDCLEFKHVAPYNSTLFIEAAKRLYSALSMDLKVLEDRVRYTGVGPEHYVRLWHNAK